MYLQTVQFFNSIQITELILYHHSINYDKLKSYNLCVLNIFFFTLLLRIFDYRKCSRSVVDKFFRLLGHIQESKKFREPDENKNFISLLHLL